MTVNPAAVGVRPAPREAALVVLRTFATISLVGAVTGALVVGILARLGMRLLAHLNPAAAGITSDDGFEIGEITLHGSLQLVAAGAQFGLLGALSYFVLRGLMTGPDWFRLASVSLGPAAVVGALVVGTEGVDFRVLHPVPLAVAIFVAVPAVYVAVLSRVSERLLAGEPLPVAMTALGLAVWVSLLPIVPIVALALVLAAALLATRTGQRLRTSPRFLWTLRALLALVFVAAVLDLVGDLLALT